jgi:hypothetical protein
MTIGKAKIDTLAKAWLAEARRLRASGTCDCGCSEPISMRTRFKPGHDAKLLKTYRATIAAILTEE